MDALADLRLCCSHMTKTCFLMMWPIETRKFKRKSTNAAFIDFRKAYAAINRNMLFKKLCEIGISGKIYNALITPYHDVKCCVKLNGFNTD